MERLLAYAYYISYINVYYDSLSKIDVMLKAVGTKAIGPLLWNYHHANDTF